VASLRHWFETMTIAPVSKIACFPKLAVCNMRVFSLSMSKRCGPRSELDSHANMIVVGDNVLILYDSGVTCPVQGYSPDTGPNEHRIVDVAIKHDCPVTAKSYMKSDLTLCRYVKPRLDRARRGRYSVSQCFYNFFYRLWYMCHVRGIGCFK
jgi:hypothetical protein